MRHMFHMLSCFDLKPGEDIEAIGKDFAECTAVMKSIDLVEDSGPVGRRQSGTGTFLSRYSSAFMSIT